MKKTENDSSTEVCTSFYSFEEIKLVYESAETVTERRISTNKFNYSISIALFIAIGFIVRFMGEDLLLLRFGCLFVFVLALIAILFVHFWRKQIEDYKNLNNIKWSIINEMTTNVSFDSSGSTKTVTSYEPFKREWDRYSDLLETPPKTHPLRLASSNMESFIPLAFGILFILAGVAAIVMFGFSFTDGIVLKYSI